jgi:glyceraldehyde 3-phosphate dehydrogenase
MMKRVTVNGLGRIGRLVTYDLATLELGEVELAHLNEPRGIDAAIETLTDNDSIHGSFDWDVRKITDNLLEINGKPVCFNAVKTIADLELAGKGIDILVECSGFYAKNPTDAFFANGIKHLLQSYDTKADLSLVMGLNEEEFDPAKHKKISNASCTTKASVMPLGILERNGAIPQYVDLVTVHAATASQETLDVLEQVSTHSTNASNAISKFFPQLAGNVDAISYRVPVLDGSIVQLAVFARYDGKLDKEMVNGWFQGAVSNRFAVFDGKEMNIKKHVQRRTENSIIALSKTTVKELMPGFYKIGVVAGYDNERGSARDIALATGYVANRM